MSDDRNKPWYQQLPAKVGAVVVFLVAVTTLAGNLFELNEKRRLTSTSVASTNVTSTNVTSPPTQTSAPPMPQASTQPAIAAGPRKLHVSLDRIAVEHDGSPGTTDWRFMVEADGEPLFAFQQDDLDDTGGRNVAMPRDVATNLRVEAGVQPKLTVKAWRGSRFRLPGTEPDATGQGVLGIDGTIAPVRVAAPEPAQGAFVLYLSTDAP